MTVAPVDVAVVIPALEAAATLDAALASVAGQTTPPTSVIVVDDHSADRTAEVADSWTAILPLRVLRQERRAGPAAARRAAIAVADAPLLALLDADDIWLPEHLETLLEVHRRHGGIVCADALRWYPGRGVRAATYHTIHPIPPPDRQAVAILSDNFVSIGALIATSDYHLAGGFRDGVSGAEDWDLWIRMLRHGGVVHGTTSPTMLYRVAGAGLTHRPDIIDTYLRVLDLVLEESRDDEERAATRAARRRMASRRRLAAAYAAARSGHRGRARLTAVPGLVSPARSALQAASLVVAPGLATRLRDGLDSRR